MTRTLTLTFTLPPLLTLPLTRYELPARINSDVSIQRVNPLGAAQLRGLIEEHLEATGSAKVSQPLPQPYPYI